LFITIGKVIKKATAKRIKSIAKLENLLSIEQIRARVRQGTSTALELFISIV
jgi:hypothetical protein